MLPIQESETLEQSWLDEPKPEERGTPSCTHTANTLLYVAALLCTAVVEFSPSFLEDTFSRVKIRKEYPTLLTPDPIAHTIWILIFGMECVFVVAQQTPRWCDTALVRVVSPWWQMSCIFQVLWSVLFALDILLPATLVMFGCLFCLLTLIVKADNQQWPNFFMYWFIRFPFSLHAGWAVAVAAMDFSILVHSRQLIMDPDPSARFPDGFVIGCNIGAFAVATTITLIFAVAVAKPDPLVPAGVAWAAFWIAVNLSKPETLNYLVAKNSLPDTGHPEVIIKGFEYLFFSLAFLFGGFSVLAYVLRLFQRCCMRGRHDKEQQRALNKPLGSVENPKSMAGGSAGTFTRAGSSGSFKKGGSGSSFGSFGKSNRSIKRGPSATKLPKSGSKDSKDSKGSGGWKAALGGVGVAEKLAKKAHSKEGGSSSSSGVQLASSAAAAPTPTKGEAALPSRVLGAFGKLKGKSASKEDPVDALERGESKEKLVKTGSSGKLPGKEGSSSKMPGKEGSASKLPKESSSSSTSSKSKLPGVGVTTAAIGKFHQAAKGSKEKSASSSSVGEDKVGGGSSSSLPRGNSKGSKK